MNSLGAGGYGPVHSSDHRVWHSPRTCRWTVTVPDVPASHSRAIVAEVSQHGQRSVVSVPSVAGKPSRVGGGGNQDHTLRAAIASCGWRIRKSCGDRSLIQPPAMFLPTVGREVFSCCWPFSSRLGQSSFQAVVGSVSIIVMLEPKEFRLQICCGPEQRAVEELAPNGADQALHERM